MNLKDALVSAATPKPVKKKRRLRHECTCADQDFCYVHPTDTDSLDPNGPWGAP